MEENGILARELTITGTTGWKPRRFPNKSVSTTAGAVKLPPEGKSYSRSVPFNILEALSGQRHFQFLQDAVFRTYGDLKRDPSTAKGTELFWHNPKDDEHWRVVPLSFEMTRESGNQNLYRYTIQLLCVEGAAQSELRPSEDFNVVEALKNANLMLNWAVTLTKSGLTDLGGVTGSINQSIQGIGTALEDAASIANATEQFLAGTATATLSTANTIAKSFINIPYSFVQSTIDSMEMVLTAFNESVTLGSSADVSGSLLNAIRKTQDGLHIIASYPDKFQQSVDAAVQSFSNKADLSTAASPNQLEAAATASPPQTVRDWETVTTALSPGDYLRSSNELGLGRNLPKYQSAVERVVEQGDSITNLAAKHLGDARLWKFLAVFNDLAPPYISPDGLPNTLAIGDTILIPSTAKSQEQRSSPVVVGVMSDRPAEDHALGEDLQLVEVSRGQYDLDVDLENGSVDARTVAGIKNLQQAMLTRLITEQGTDILYKRLGTQRVVGLGLIPVDLETAQLRLMATIQDDPRVAGVRRIEVQNGPPDDAIYVDMEVEVRGLSRPEKVVVRK